MIYNKQQIVTILGDFLKFEDYLYHCTFKENLDSILKSGLCLKYKGSFGGKYSLQRAIYLTRDYKIVLNYKLWKEKLSEIVVLKISLLELDMNKMYFDEDTIIMIAVNIMSNACGIDIYNPDTCSNGYQIMQKEKYKSEYIKSLKNIFPELNKNDCENIYYSILGFIKSWFLSDKKGDELGFEFFHKTMLNVVFKLQKYVKCFLYYKCKLDIYMKFFGLIYPNCYKLNQHELYKNFAYRGWISPKLIEIVDTPFK